MCLFIHDITDLIFHHELIFRETENIFQIFADKIKFLCTFYGLIYASEKANINKYQLLAAQAG